MANNWSKAMPADIERIYVSMKTKDLEELDFKVRWLKENGWPAMNRSRLLRIAIGALDVERMVGPLLDLAPGAEVLGEKKRKTRDGRMETTQIKTIEVRVCHCGYCGESGHNIRSCPHIEEGVDNEDPPIITIGKEDSFG